MREDIREVFNYFFSKTDDKISIPQVGLCLRALGYTPTEKQLQTVTKPRSDDARVSLEEFVPIVNDMEQERQRVKQPTINDYIEALNQLDREGEGTIPSSLLRHALSTTGERLTHDEIDRLLFGLEKDDGRIVVTKFVNRVCDMSAKF
uniref:EF-hand domain-containing protein n=1 Tax=Syphacia muris TaxID=451379 RepID=A0A0N5ADF0_9BILA